MFDSNSLYFLICIQQIKKEFLIHKDEATITQPYKQLPWEKDSSKNNKASIVATLGIDISFYFRSLWNLSSWLFHPHNSEGKKRSSKFLKSNCIDHHAEHFACKYDTDLGAFWTSSAWICEK